MIAARLKAVLTRILEGHPKLHLMIAVAREAVSYPAFWYCMIRGKPYFGLHMASHQLWRERAPYMASLARRATAERGRLRMIEIGSWAGESAVLWATSAKETLRNTPTEAGEDRARVVCIDPWRFYVTLTANPRTWAMGRALRTNAIFRLFLHNVKCSGNEDVVVPIRASSQAMAELLHNGMFDIIYVDGDHAYASVATDIRSYAPLVADGGYLCGDDLEAQLHEVDREHAKAHAAADTIRDPKTGRYFHPGIALAIGEFFGEVSSYAGFWVMQRRGTVWRKVELTTPVCS